MSELGHFEILQLSSRIVSSLASTVAPTLGPSSVDQIIVGHGGDVLITNSGYSVLKSVNIEGPIGKFVLTCTKKINEVCGDGCTTYVIMLDGLLKSSIYLASDMSSHTSGGFSARNSTALNRLSIAVNDIRKIWYPRILHPMMKEWALTCNGGNWEKIMFRLLQSNIMGKFGHGIHLLLSSILMDWIKASFLNSHGHLADSMRVEDAIFAIDTIDTYFPILCVPKATLNDTKVVSNSYILRNSFARVNTHNYHQSMDLYDSNDSTSITKRFIVVTGSLSLNFDRTKRLYSNKVTVKLHVDAALQDSTSRVETPVAAEKVWGEYPKKRALKFSKYLHDCGIDLVLCTEEIDDHWKKRFHSSWHIGRTVCRAKRC